MQEEQLYIPVQSERHLVCNIKSENQLHAVCQKVHKSASCKNNKYPVGCEARSSLRSWCRNDATTVTDYMTLMLMMI